MKRARVVPGAEATSVPAKRSWPNVPTFGAVVLTLSWLDLPDLGSCAGVCSNLQYACSSDPLWRQLHERLAGKIYSSRSAASGCLKLRSHLRRTAVATADRYHAKIRSGISCVKALEITGAGMSEQHVTAPWQIHVHAQGLSVWVYFSKTDYERFRNTAEVNIF